MRLLADKQLGLSPTDLANHLACAHLTQLELRVQRGELERPHVDDPYGQIIMAKGNVHEAAYLERIETSGLTVARMRTYDDEGFDETQARRDTEDAIRAAEADVIYQAFLTSGDGTWRGFADFLVRLPDGTYEPVDTKLARSAKPLHAIQLCFYAEQLERIQGRLPEHLHVELGSGERETLRTADFIAFYRRSRERLLRALAGEGAGETWPWPVYHCTICDFRHVCSDRRAAEDHPVLVAGLGRLHAERLQAAGIRTLTALAETTAPGVPRIRPETFERLRSQAGLQLRFTRTGERAVELLADEEDRGFRLLPPPSEGDVWLDLEGHPFFEPARGLEYLFGWCYRDAGELRYEVVWGLDRAGEKVAFERFVDWVQARRGVHPDLHVYHYAGYERTALRRLMGEHSTREREIDDWLRQELLVDLYRVVKQALRAGVTSYSIKEIEKLYGFVRTAAVAGGDESVVLFEQWLEAGEGALLEGIRAYNEEDCRSTVALHEWLLGLRPPGLPWRAHPDEREKTEEAEERDAVRIALHDALLANGEEGSPHWLLAHLLYYHQREAKSQWWEWFHHLELDEDELIEDTDTIGGLRPVGEPVEDGQSLVYTLAFPPQEHKIDGRSVDPKTEKAYDVATDDEHGTLTFRRATARAEEPLPAALVPPQPIPDWHHRDAVQRFARSYLEGDRAGALVEILERRPPRARLDASVAEAALSLAGGHLFVQGPPGSGKTWQGAKAAVALMQAGRRVGITSLSHKAIANLLSGIEREARKQGYSFRGRKKSSGGDTRYEGPFVDSSDHWRDLLDEELELVAGTSWLFSRADFTGFLDTLIVDEAGQVALADVLAVGHAARNLVLLGDPNQLPQVSQGAMPDEAKASVLGHLLDDAKTVPPDRGIFLERTWRLRPELTAFTSDAYYAGRLEWEESCAARSVEAGNGLVYRSVEHAANGQLSREEADAVAEAIRALLGTGYTDETGATRPLGVEDVLVVTPYNAQVRALRQTVPAGVRVGTVDKFQGQEAPVVIVSLASSSGEDAPRGLSFVFNANRINVATSRAQCRVELVCSPLLLEADCRSIEEMRLVNALCRFVELAAG
ncbi:MAG TPA: TM0106 family RecB-like putative nuclease [Gaiella sp.]|nr:TM0106 family RecB-like putative nuclease [Gaiella sp.]